MKLNNKVVSALLMGVMATSVLPAVALATGIDAGPNSEVMIDYTTIELTDKKLEKTLAANYSAYNVVVTNKGPHTIEMINGDVTNGVNGQQAFETSKRNTSGRALGWFIATGGIGAAVSAARNTAKNKAARSSSIGFDNKIPLGPLPVGASADVDTFVPIGTKPQVKVIFKDSATGEILFSGK